MGRPQPKTSTASEAVRLDNSFQLEPVGARRSHDGFGGSIIEENIWERESDRRVRANTSKCYNCGHIWRQYEEMDPRVEVN